MYSTKPQRHRVYVWRFLLHSTEPTVRVDSPSDLMSTVIYFSRTFQLLCRRNTAVYLLRFFADKGLVLSTTLRVYPHFVNVVLRSQSKMFLNICLGYSHSWLGTHEWLLHLHTRNVICYLVASDSELYPKFYAIQQLAFLLAVQRVIKLQDQIWVHVQVL